MIHKISITSTPPDKCVPLRFVSSIENQVEMFREQLNNVLKLPIQPYQTLTPPPTELYKELQTVAGDTGRLTDMAIPHGNCFFFRSVSKELLGTQAHHTIIREILIEFIEQDRAHFSKVTEMFGRPFPNTVSC